MDEKNPFRIFETWYDEARESEPNDSNAMALATADKDGRPSVRMVLLKGYGPDGFVFYTNLHSRKGEELAVNENVALLFHWKSLRRQIRIEGPVEQIDDKVADAYFASRNRDSQLGAWASDQSHRLESRQIFMDRFKAMEERFAGKDVPRPPHWSGFRVDPLRIEFWQDREHRLHERRLFVCEDSIWSEGLLYP